MMDLEPRVKVALIALGVSALFVGMGLGIYAGRKAAAWELENPRPCPGCGDAPEAFALEEAAE